MAFSLLKVVRAIQGIEPRIQEKLGPFSPPQNEASMAQALSVLRQNEIGFITLEVTESMDNRVRRHHWNVFLHQGFNP